MLPERIEKIGRDDRIRTCDPLTPSQVRYQAALHPERRTTCARVLLSARAASAPRSVSPLPSASPRAVISPRAPNVTIATTSMNHSVATARPLHHPRASTALQESIA